MVEQPSREELMQLEIDAFMTPHIKRARIVLVLVGALYAYTGYETFGTIDAARKAATGGPASSVINTVWAFIVFTFIVGVAFFVLAAIAGKKPIIAMYTAMGLFVAHTAFLMYITEGLPLTSWVWWLTAIGIGLGFDAARKIHKLKTQGQPA